MFDERYVSQFVFQPDEVVKNSFEIFINTPEYQAGIEELEAIFEDLKGVFVENAALDLSRADLVPCDGDENVGGVRAGRGGRGDLVAADADGDVAERAQGPDDLADAVAGGLLQVA